MRSREPRADLADIDSPWLVGLLATKLDTLDAKVARGRVTPETARLAVEVVPKLLGGDGDRRYFVAFQTPAELRGDGGLIGNFAEITYHNGDISLDAQRSATPTGTRATRASRGRSPRPRTTSAATAARTPRTRSRTSRCRPTSRASRR